MYEQFQKQTDKIEAEAQGRQDQGTKLDGVDENLQTQINKIIEARKQTRLDYQTQSEQDLQEGEILGTNRNFTQGLNEKYKEDIPTYEDDKTLIDWSQPRYNEYRAFNIKALRDVFFSLLN